MGLPKGVAMTANFGGVLPSPGCVFLHMHASDEGRSKWWSSKSCAWWACRRVLL